MSSNTTTSRPAYYNPALTHVMQDTKAIMAIVGANTERLRRERGISMGKIAKAVGCSDVMIYYICSGKREYCSIALMAAIAHYFGYSLLDWLRGPLPEGLEPSAH